MIGEKDGGDWASRGEREPWVQLDFAKPVRTDRIVIYDRPGTLDDARRRPLSVQDFVRKNAATFIASAKEA